MWPRCQRSPRGALLQCLRDTRLCTACLLFLSAFTAELVVGSKSLTQARKMLITCCFSTKLREKCQLVNLLKAVFQSKRSAVSKCFYHPEVKNISADASQHLLARTASVANKTCFIYLQVESGCGALVEFYNVQGGSSNYWAQKLAPVWLHQLVRDV